MGVYGLVAGIVKMDDLGSHLMKQTSNAKQKIGRFLLSAAAKLVKFLSIARTLAMFLVGGGILVNGIDFLHNEAEYLAKLTGIFESITTMLLNALVTLIVVAIATMIGNVRGNKPSSAH